MKNLKHKGRAVKSVHNKDDLCDDCIFNNAGCGRKTDRFEENNKLLPCYITKVKYIYE